jgi:Zn-dependent M28 family amino/carboxypeptidase
MRQHDALALLALLALPPAAKDGPDPVDLAMVEQIRAGDLRRDLEYLASDELEGRATPSPGQEKAATFLEKRFEELRLEPGGAKGTYGQPVELSRSGAERVRNVVGILRGTDPEAGALVLSAHYDHIGVGKKPNANGDRICNGADDDASGTVAVLAIARAYAARRSAPRRTVIFALFTAEEIGGLGSRAYVGSPPVPLAKTLCDVNVEMIGRTHGVGPRRAWVTGHDLSTLGAILAKGARAAGVEVFADPYPEQNFYRRSDNFSFVRKGVIGHSVSAGSTHGDYHTPEDEANRIDYANLEALARGIYLGSSLIASGRETPAPTERSVPASKPASVPAR